MQTDLELQRLRRIASRNEIQPVSRLFLPRDLVTSYAENFGIRADFFVVVPTRFTDPIPGRDDNNVVIYPEGSCGYRAWIGQTFQR